MLFIYNRLRGSLSVGVMFTLLLLLQNVKSMPLLEQRLVSQPQGKGTSLSFKQHLPKNRDSDQILIRLAVVFFGVILVFAMLICLCATFWCASWVIPWPSFTWNRIIPRRCRGSNRKQMAMDSNDLPPAYELIFAYQEDERATTSNAESRPPSYSDALLNSKVGAL